MPRPRFLSIEQKVVSLNEKAGELRTWLRQFWQVTDVSLEDALSAARRIAEFVVMAALKAEGLSARHELLDNIEALGGRDERAVKGRGGRKEPILPPPVYAALHGVRIYGNLVVHPFDADTLERKVQVGPVDLQAALALLLRAVEWYFLEYPKGPRPPVDPLYVEAAAEPALGQFAAAST
jgi:hypothetical protein